MTDIVKKHPIYPFQSWRDCVIDWLSFGCPYSTDSIFSVYYLFNPIFRRTMQLNSLCHGPQKKQVVIDEQIDKQDQKK
mgnify:CR=1 FL=1